MKRRALALLLAAAAAFAADVRGVTILHTNDLHAHLSPSNQGEGGFAQLAAAIRHERENCPSCLLLNAGDLVQGTPVSTIYHGVPIYEIANLFSFDAATLGNHEFDYGWQTALKFLEIARYPVVCANVVSATGSLMTAKPYVILNADGVRVGVIGAMMENLRFMTTAKALGHWRTLPVVETVRRYLPQLRRDSDLIVLLGHLTEGEEKAVLQSLPEVAVLVTGHEHRGMSAAMQYDGRIAVRIKGYGAELGRLDLRVDLERKALVSWAWKRIPITAGGPAAEDVGREVKRWEAQVAQVVDTPIGVSRREYKDADLKLLVERAMAEEMKTDFAYVNRGGLRDTLPQGRILARDIWNIMPFDNVVVVAKIKGSDLPPSLAKGRKIDPERVYTLASTDFTAANQGLHTELGAAGLRFSTGGPLLRDLLIGWFKKQREVGD